MATEEIQISQLELAQEVQGDMVFAVDTATDTKSLSVNQLKNHISQPLQANINAVDTSALHKYNISNCITYIPQDIKLELNNGTLTLKAGSKVYYPDGTSYTLTSDKTFTYTGNGVKFIQLDSSYNMAQWGVADSYSGSTAPTVSQYMQWYDTTNNTIKRTFDSGSTWSGNYSFPICIVTVSNGAISSIDQVFNGFGYIGSTVFTLPGVKHIYSQGFNSDGTLHSVEHTVSKVITRTETDSYTNKVLAVGDYIGLSDYIYDKATNYLYAYHITIANRRPNLTAFAIASATTGGKITSLTPKTVFHAVDYNDTMLKEDWVKVSTAPASPDSSKFYYIPEN